MAFTRFTGGSFVVGGRSIRTWLLLLGALLASGPGMTRVSAAATLPPGADPCFTNAVPAGYGTFVLLKSASFLQSSAAAPTGGLGLASIRLAPPAAYGVSNAIVNGPAGFQAGLVPQPDGSQKWTEEGTESALQSRLPAGAWSTLFQLVFTNGDSFVGFFPFTLASNVPPAAQVVNYDAAQAIDSTAAFTLNWSAWAGSGAADRISLQIVDGAGKTVASAATDCSGETTLPGGATSYTLPAGRLAAGTTYTGYLTFGASLLAAQDDASLVVERAFQSRTTRFSLRTASGGGPGTPAEFLNPAVSGTNLVFVLKGAPGSRHAIESSADFVVWQTEIEVLIPASGQAQVAIPLPPGGPPRFYRARALGETPPQPGEPADLAISLVGPRQVQIQVKGTAGSSYAIESSANYASWNQVTNITIPAGATQATVTLSVPGTTDFLVYRAVTTGTAPPPVIKPPTLAMEPAGAGVRLVLTNGSPLQDYRFERASADWTTWGPTTFVIRTDAEGKGSLAIPVAPTDALLILRALAP